MKITITMDLTADNLNKLKALLPDEQIPGQLSLFDSPSEAPVERHTEAPAPEAPKIEETPKTETSAITQTDIRAAATKLSKAGKQEELVAIFAKFGGKKLSDFKERPEVYPDLMRELVNANG